MTRYYRRRDPGPGDDLKAGLLAGALAVMTAGVSFYLVRILLTREPLEPLRSRAGGVDPDERSERDLA